MKRSILILFTLSLIFVFTSCGTNFTESELQEYQVDMSAEQLELSFKCIKDINRLSHPYARREGFENKSNTEIFEDCYEVNKYLLKKGANVNSSQGSTTYLMYAAKYNSLKTVKLLIKNNVDSSKQDNQGYTALHFVLDSKYLYENDDPLEILSLLLQSGANPDLKNENGKTPLIEAIEDHHRYTQMSFDEKNYESKVAVLDEAIDILLEYSDPDIQDNDGNSALIIVTNYGQSAIAKKLLDKGADPNIYNMKGETPLIIVADQNLPDTTIADVLIKHGAEVNKVTLNVLSPKYRQTPFQTPLTSSIGKQDSLEYFIQHGADINLQFHDGHTPLMLGVINARYNNLNTLYYLLESGADLNVCNTEGLTPITFAGSSKSGMDKDAIKSVLNEFGANEASMLATCKYEVITETPEYCEMIPPDYYEVVQKMGGWELGNYAIQGNIGLLTCMKNQGIDLNVNDGELFTAVFSKYKYNYEGENNYYEKKEYYLQIMEWLLENGVSPNGTYANTNPIKYAVSTNDTALLELFSSYDIDTEVKKKSSIFDLL